jgi:hypothetical protein
MKKSKKVEDLTHLDIFNLLIYDENIQDNLSVSNDYDEDEHGNNVITIGFEGVPDENKISTNGMVLLMFNREGRLINMEMATKEKKAKKWQVAVSEKFVDMKSRFIMPPTNRLN